MKKIKIIAPLVLLVSFLIFAGFSSNQKVNTKLATMEVTVICNGVPYTGESAMVHILGSESGDPLVMESTNPSTGVAYLDVSSLAYETYFIQVFSPCGDGGEYWYYDGEFGLYQEEVEVD